MSAISSDKHRHVANRRTTRRAVAVTAISAAITAGTAAAPAAAGTADHCSSSSTLGVVTCVYAEPSRTAYVLRVPDGVPEVHIEGRGAGGGNGGAIESGRPAPEGGPGGVVSAEFPVTGGDLLRILVGGRGENARGMRPGAGGLNGGGKGGAGALGGGGGGGASSVRLGGTDLGSRILVAGGGGGAGGATTSAARSPSGRAGDGRGAVTSTAVSSAGGGAGGGERAGNGSGDIVGKGGVGAIGPSGGAGLRRPTGLDGHSGYNADWGGGGGEGGYGASDTVRFKRGGTWATGPVGAGGGGGGYAGGSGGAAGPMLGGGGGGGSGFVATSAAAPSVARLDSIRMSNGGTGRPEDGRVTIRYRIPTEEHGGSEVVLRFRSEPATPVGRER